MPVGEIVGQSGFALSRVLYQHCDLIISGGVLYALADVTDRSSDNYEQPHGSRQDLLSNPTANKSTEGSSGMKRKPRANADSSTSHRRRSEVQKCSTCDSSGKAVSGWGTTAPMSNELSSQK